MLSPIRPPHRRAARAARGPGPARAGPGPRRNSRNAVSAPRSATAPCATVRHRRTLPARTVGPSGPAATGDAGAGALHGSFLARCGRPRTIPCDRRTCRRRSKHSVPAGSRSQEGDNPALRQRGNRPSGLHRRDKLNGCPFLFSFGGSRPPSCLGRPLARLSRIINVIRNAPGQSSRDRGYSRAQPRCCVVNLHSAWPVAALRFPYYSALYGIKKGSRRCVVPTAPCVLVGQRLQGSAWRRCLSFTRIGEDRPPRRPGPEATA